MTCRSSPPSPEVRFVVRRVDAPLSIQFFLLCFLSLIAFGLGPRSSALLTWLSLGFPLPFAPVVNRIREVRP
jgi:hypothetical protein